MLANDLYRHHAVTTRWEITKSGSVVAFVALGLLMLSLSALAAPPGTAAFVNSTFDAIAHGEDAEVGEFSVFVNATEDENGWTVQVAAAGGIECEWADLNGDHFTETSGEFGVHTDSQDATGDCSGESMHVFVSAEFVTSNYSVNTREQGQHCLGEAAGADYFEATVVVTHAAMEAPVEIVTTDTHYQTVEGWCHATGTPGNPNS